MRRIRKKMDKNILLYLQRNVRTPRRNVLFRGITRLGDLGAVWLVISAALLSQKKTRKAGHLCITALILSVLVNDGILKNIFQRKRPFRKIKELKPLIKRPEDYSFPSGHTASSFAAAGVLYRYLPRAAGVLGFLIAGLIGFSRIYLGVHYPTDVLCGMVSGLGISQLLMKHYVETKFFKC